MGKGKSLGEGSRRKEGGEEGGVGASRSYGILLITGGGMVRLMVRGSSDYS